EASFLLSALRSLASAMFYNWRIRSRVTPKSLLMPSSVLGLPPWRPKRSKMIFFSRSSSTWISSPKSWRKFLLRNNSHGVCACSSATVSPNHEPLSHTEDHSNRYWNPSLPPLAVQQFNDVDSLRKLVPMLPNDKDRLRKVHLNRNSSLAI